MKIVMDTDTIVAALRSPTGASAALLRHVRNGNLRLAASVPLFAEYEAVCTRPQHLQASGLSYAEVQQFLDGLAFLIEPIAIYYLWRPQLRDPADELVLEAAVNAQADALLSFNHRHFQRAAPRFGLRLMTPADFLRSM